MKKNFRMSRKLGKLKMIKKLKIVLQFILQRG